MRAIGKILLGILVFFIFLAIAGFVLIKYYPKEVYSLLLPDITNITMDASQEGKGKMHLMINADISPNPIPYFLDSVRYKAVLYGDTITTGTKKFKKEDLNKLKLPMDLDYKKLVKIMKKHQGDSSVVQFLTTSFLHIPLVGEKDFDFNKDLKFKMIIFPEVKISKIDVEHFGLNNMVLKVNMKLTNPNDIAMDVSDMKYTMHIDQYLQTKGVSNKVIHLKANGTSNVSIDMKSDIDKPMKAIGQALKGKNKWPYTINSEMVIKPDTKKKEKLNFSIALDGNLDSDKLKKK